jgi:1-acyl-sn-glycerol-3-phosphate acyltransferase
MICRKGAKMNQLSLLGQRKFWPFFWTQFFGAFNDNLFKNALVILVAYGAMQSELIENEHLVALIAGVFILPFFLFSGVAGEISDKYPKAHLVRIIKAAECLIMLLAAIGFLLNSLYFLLVVLFLMGSQSALFGPVKYSILPEMVLPEELVGSNALVETGTFVAILLGTIAGGLLVTFQPDSRWMLSSTVVLIAALGLLSSLAMGIMPAGQPDLKVAKNPITPTIDILRQSRKKRPIFLSILGISWFWFLGICFLSVLPIFTKDVLGADEIVVTFLLSLFCVGISLGSLLCERLSDRHLELGLVPFGSLGISLVAFDLFMASRFFEPALSTGLSDFSTFIQSFASVRICVDLLLMAVFCGLYTVPLYTMIQQRSEPAVRSRVIAGNNILNALFMVLSSLALMGMYALEISIPTIFLILALANAIVAAYIYTVIPEFLLRFFVWMLAAMMYRLKVINRERLPMAGPAIVVCNHVSFVDWMFITSAIRTPIRFVMDNKYFNMPVLRFLFRDAKMIPIAKASQNKELMEQAFDKIAAELEDEQIVCIFPEGKLTSDGQIDTFRAGIERIVQRSPVPVIPLALSGLWGSRFSRYKRKKGKKSQRPFRPRVKLIVGKSVPPERQSAVGLEKTVKELFDSHQSKKVGCENNERIYNTQIEN